MRRTWLGVAAAFALLAGCGGGGDDKIAAPSPALGTVVDYELPAAIANLPLTRPDGTKTSLAAYRGKAVMFTDFMTECTDICPMITANTVALARALAADGYGARVAVVEISMDPRRDTLRRLRAYQKLYGAPPSSWTLLRASPSDTERFWRYFGLGLKRVPEGTPPDVDWLTGDPLTYDIEHADELIFLDATGRERFVVSASPNVQGRGVPKRLADVLGRQGRRLLHHPDPVTSWTVGQGLSVFSWLVDHRLPLPK